MCFVADANMLNTLKSLLGDNADEKIGAVMNALKNSQGNGTSGSISDTPAGVWIFQSDMFLIILSYLSL